MTVYPTMSSKAPSIVILIIYKNRDRENEAEAALSLCYIYLGIILILAIIRTCNYNIEVKTLIVVIWEYGTITKNKSDGAGRAKLEKTKINKQRMVNIHSHPSFNSLLHLWPFIHATAVLSNYFICNKESSSFLPCLQPLISWGLISCPWSQSSRVAFGEHVAIITNSNDWKLQR